MGTNADHFPSCSKPLFQGEAKCEAIERYKNDFCSHANRLIFIKKVLQLASFWNWRFLELENGRLQLQLFYASIVSRPVTEVWVVHTLKAWDCFDMSSNYSLASFWTYKAKVCCSYLVTDFSYIIQSKTCRLLCWEKSATFSLQWKLKIKY